ncbi:MAG: large conductance mechanosensitive channel protein MscL [Alphaproteobacteria bacterium]|nr:large conductance mechanosensitive channel protein MscL [Alphaproteobacteria bacterium]MBL7099624.1 large conductance mechanosensitive channel protein MscL [Alphaproteobacteria bacterium]
MFKEFRTFIVRGNVVDLAVGIMIGAAFTAIVNSLVKDILTPPIGILLGGLDLSNFFLVIKGDRAVQTLKQATDTGAVTLNYGLFINAVLNFLIIAFVLFLVVRQINRMKAPEAPKPPAETPEDILLLREIRDQLKARNS